jgi:predicted transposase/invertase (TIGR01784 family)
MRYAVEKSFEEGLAEGLTEGKRETARNLKRLGIPAATIAEATGLTTEDIETL